MVHDDEGGSSPEKGGNGAKGRLPRQYFLLQGRQGTGNSPRRSCASGMLRSRACVGEVFAAAFGVSVGPLK
jgi:hypothetical protein